PAPGVAPDVLADRDARRDPDLDHHRARVHVRAADPRIGRRTGPRRRHRRRDVLPSGRRGRATAGSRPAAVRVAVVGTGSAGRRHLGTLAELGVTELIAVNEHRPGPSLAVDGASVTTVHDFGDALAA